MHLKSLPVLLSVLAVAGFLVFFFSGDQGLTTFYRSARQIRSMNKEIVDANRVIDSLQLEIHRLKNDTVYIEKIAREKFGMARKDEKMYKFIEEK